MEYYGTKYAAIEMKRQKKGVIVNIASIAGLRGITNAAHYGASKGAIINFTKSVAQELAPYNIRVNTIAPGLIESNMTKDIIADKNCLEPILLLFLSKGLVNQRILLMAHFTWQVKKPAM